MIYYLLLFSIASALAFLFLLNLVPHVTVKSLGWLSLRHISIETATYKISIHKIKLAVKLFKYNNSVRPFQLEISDIDILFKEKAVNELNGLNRLNGVNGLIRGLTLEVSLELNGEFSLDTQGLNQGSSSSNENKGERFLSESFLKEGENKGFTLPEISFFLPSFLCKLVSKYKIFNQFQVHFFRYSILHDNTGKDVQLFVEYTKVEQSLVDIKGNFNITMINCHVRNRNDIKNQKLLFKNFEFNLTTDIIVTCPLESSNRGKLAFLKWDKLAFTKRDKLTFSRFQIKASLGQFFLPLDMFDLEAKIRKLNEKKKEKIPPVDVGEKTNDDIVTKKKHDNSKVSSRFSPQLIQDIIDKVESVDLKLEEFKLIWGVYEINTASFSARIDRVDSYKLNENLLKLGLYMTSFIILDQNSKCVELPACSFATEANAIELIEGAVDAFNPDQKKPINFESSVTISSPTFQIYFDQIETFMSRQSAKNEKNKDKKSKRNLSFLNKLSLLSFKFYIVDLNVVHFTPNPKTFGSESTFHRESKENVITTSSILSVVYRIYTRKYRDMLRNSKSRKNKINSQLLIKGLKVDSSGNSFVLPKLNSLASYDIDHNEITLDVKSKALKFKSVNDIIFVVVRAIRNKRIIRYNERCNFMSQKRELGQDKNTFLEGEYVTVVPYIKLFELIPPLFAKVRFSITNIQTEVICKDGLPSHIIYDESLGRDIDLNEFKRGISLKVNDLNFKYQLSKEIFDVSLKQLQCFTISEFSNEFITDFDDVQEYVASDAEFSDISSADSSQSFENDYESDSEELDSKKIKRVLLIHDLSLTNSDRIEGDVDKLFLSIPEIDGRIDMFFIWCAFYAKSLLAYFAPTVQKNVSRKDMEPIIGHKHKLKLDVFIESVSMVVRLPHKVDVMIELDGMKFDNVFVSRSMNFKYWRLYVIHPATKKWRRLLVVTKPDVSLNLTRKIQHSAVKVFTERIRLNVPHLFALFKVIDNFLTLVKAIKQVSYNFKHTLMQIGDYERLMPAEKPIIELPKILIKAKVFGLSVENDPFENELSYIFELGLIEQRERISMLKLFEEGAAEIMAKSDPDIESKVKLSDLKPEKKMEPLSSKHTFLKFFGDYPTATRFKEKLIKFKNTKNIPVGGVYDMTPPIASSNAESDIHKAKERLENTFSNSWVQKFKVFRLSKLKQWSERHSEVWGDEKVSEIMTQKFELLDYPTGPHLLSFIVRDMEFNIERPRVKDIHEFLYTHGNKQPKLQYSILVPLYLNVVAGSLILNLLDYSLPLILFPERTDSKPAVHLHGNVIINERLVKEQNQMRHIFVPFSPAAPLGEMADVFYSVFIPRTLETVKFTFDLQWDITSDRPSMLTWCKSYQAGILAAAAALSNFSKPHVDDSPLGWWDKFSLLMHGRMRFDIKEELSLNMKSSTSPYQMTGPAAGFVFCWKDDVTLKINYDGLGRLLQLDSNVFVLAIPNYALHDKKVWGSFYSLEKTDDLDIDESKRFSKKVIQLSSSERVRWTFGMTYERNVDETLVVSNEKERTSDFPPHYDVVITNPDFPDHKDSFKTFRSNYINMSLSVVSTAENGVCFNAAYFTPLSFHYFFDWWHTLHGSSSMPIRRGKLFLSLDTKKEKAHVKMGTHIVTVKYLFQFDPVTISHAYSHPSSISADSRIAFTGLKARFDQCSIELHQRKELLTYVNEKLDINNQVAHLKMNKGEINIENAEFRICNAVFSERSIRGYLLSNMVGFDQSDVFQFSGKPHIDITSYEDWISNAYVEDGNYSWIDPEDFIELEMKEPLSPYPKIEVFKFCSSPKFSYFREFTDLDEGPYPYSNESDGCDDKTVNPETTQSDLLQIRIKNLKKSIASEKENLNSLPEQSSKRVESEKNLMQLQEKLDVIESVWESFTGENILTANSMYSNQNLTNSKSRQLSVYSTHTTPDEMKLPSQLDAVANSFRNRFIVHNLQLQWTNRIRDLFTKYLHNVSDRKSSVYFMSKQAVDFIQGIIKDTPQAKEFTDSPEENFKTEFNRGEDVINNFYDNLTETDNSDQESENIYLVRFIHPQLQLVSEKEKDSCVIVASRDLQLRVLEIRKKGTAQMVDKNAELKGLAESRYGVMFEDAAVLVAKKGEISKSHLSKPNVDGSLTWPPWLETEVCYDTSFVQDQLVIEKNTIALIYKKPNTMFASESKAKCDVFTVQLSKIVMNVTSAQYATLFYVGTNLLLHSRSDQDNLYNRLDKMVSLSDNYDLQGLDIRANELQQKIRVYRYIALSLNYPQMEKQDQLLLTSLEFSLEKLWLELTALIEGMRIKSLRFKTDKSKERIFNILADQVIWHLLDSERKPFIDFAINNPKFHMVDAFDGSKVNKLEIALMQGFNLQPSAAYPELFQPQTNICDAKEAIITIGWTMLEPVGGIPVLQNAKVDVQPLILQLDYFTTKELFKYLFPKDEDDIKQKEKKDVNKKAEKFTNTESQKSELSTKASSYNQKDHEKSRNPFKRIRRRLHDSDSDASSIKSDTGSRVTSESGSRHENGSKGTNDTQHSKQSILSSPNKKAEHGDDLALIINRSSQFMSIINIDISKFKLMVSFDAPPHLVFLDAYKLSMNIPNLKYQGELWSTKDIVLQIRKDIIKIILSHTGKIIGNKFKIRKKVKNDKPLKQISDFSKFVTVQDLQESGRLRDAAAGSNGVHPHYHPHHRRHHYKEHGSDTDFDKVLQEIMDEDDKLIDSN